MYFEIDPLLFIDEEAFDDLERLISHCTYKNKHLIIVNTSCFSTSNFRKLSSRLQETVKAAFTWLINTNVNRSSQNYIYVSNKSAEDRALNLELSYYLANRDFEILIENSSNDQLFLESLINNYSPKGSNLRKYRDNGWLKYGNGGGCSNFINYITGELRQFNNICGTKPNYFFLRLFPILDCDRIHDGEPINKYQIKNETYFIEKGIKYHILERRCMENYLPDDALKEISGYPNRNKLWFDAYISLSQNQKQFLNFNKGILKGSKITYLPTTEFKDLPQEVQLLFNNLSSLNLERLNQGLQLSNYKTTIPEGFSKPSANKSSFSAMLSSQTDINELQTIINKIEDII